ncbi:MAG: hypothetical protein LUO93_01815 [Methanomicrobiales archaeon]|nr:hypothetical protein [Methanomicrobiales archaeon]
MDPTIRSALAGFIFLILIIIGTMLIPSPSGSLPDGASPTPTVITLVASRTTTIPGPTPSGSPQATTPVPATTAVVQAHLDSVDASQLELGRTSYAYITLSNTGTVPITKIRTEISAGKDFGFPLGYQSRDFIHELYDRIEPGETRTLRDEFDLPLSEGIISLEGLYQVTIRIYANDWYYVGAWQGEVYLKG